MRFDRWILGGVSLAMMATAGAQVTKQGNAYLFRMKFNRGETLRYVMTASGAMSGQAFTMDMSLGMKVLSVANKVATLKCDVGAMKIKLNGKPLNIGMGAAQQKTVKVDDRGQPVDGAGVDMGSITFPERAITVGTKWDGTMESQTPMGGSESVKASYKFVGIQDGGKAAKIAITVKGTGKAEATGSGYLLVSVKDGSLIKNVTTMNVAMGASKLPVTAIFTRK